jgi:hypothetical protein
MRKVVRIKPIDALSPIMFRDRHFTTTKNNFKPLNSIGAELF